MSTGSFIQDYVVKTKWGDRPLASTDGVNPSTDDGKTIVYDSITDTFVPAAGGTGAITGIGAATSPSPPTNVGLVYASTSLGLIKNLQAGSGILLTPLPAPAPNDTSIEISAVPVNAVRTPTTMQYQKVATTTTPATGEFSRDGSTLYFHQTDLSGRNSDNNFDYLNSLITARIPRVFLFLNNSALQLGIQDIAITLTGNVWAVECDAFVFTDGDIYNFEFIVRPDRLLLQNGNLITNVVVGSTDVNGTVDVRVGNANNYTFTNQKLTTAIPNYETFVVNDNDIPNRKFVVDLGANYLINGGNPVSSIILGANSAPSSIALWQRGIHKLTFGDPATNNQRSIFDTAVYRDVATGTFLAALECPDNTSSAGGEIAANELNAVLYSNLRHNKFKDGTEFQWNSGYADPSNVGARGGAIKFTTGGNLGGWPNNNTNGSIFLNASLDRSYIMDSVRKVFRVDCTNIPSQAYELGISQPDDFPNVKWVQDNFQPLPLSPPSRFSVVWEDNATSSGGASSAVQYIQGVATAVGFDFTIAGNNKITYTGAATKFFTFTYSYTPTPDSLDRALQVYFIINDTNDTNPTEPRVTGSRSVYNAQSQVNYTLTVTKSFDVTLNQNDTVRAFLTNTLNANNTVIRDFSVNIRIA